MSVTLPSWCRGRRAQTAFEFSIMVGIAMVVFVVMMILINDLSYTYSEDERRSALMSYGRELQNEVLLAASVHDGYRRHVDLPEEIGRFEYEITTSSDGFTIVSGQHTVMFFTPEISGSFVKGENVIFKNGTITINP